MQTWKLLKLSRIGTTMETIGTEVEGDVLGTEDGDEDVSIEITVTFIFR